MSALDEVREKVAVLATVWAREAASLTPPPIMTTDVTPTADNPAMLARIDAMDLTLERLQALLDAYAALYDEVTRAARDAPRDA